ncbi:MAG: diphthine--ammonia ligase [Chloroflexota bacterium]
MEQAFASWSGGKDCCLALYRAIASGLQVSYLVNTVSEDGLQSRSHGLAAKWVQMQAQAIGIPVIQQPTAKDNYEAQFKSVLRTLNRQGITAGVFGDIDFNAHREWVDRVCAETGMTPHLPLWEENQKALFQEFIDLGFEAVVVSTRADVLGEEWLGRKLDAGFLADLAKLPGVTACGEAGEYHTLVIDGPLFQKRIEITAANKVLRECRWFLEITDCGLKPKREKVR